MDSPFSVEEQDFYSALETHSRLQFNRYLKEGTVMNQMVRCLQFPCLSLGCARVLAIDSAIHLISAVIRSPNAFHLILRRSASGSHNSACAQGNVLTMLLRLRQACDHPYLLPGTKDMARNMVR